MRKADLVRAVTEASGIDAVKVTKAIEFLLSSIRDALRRHEKVQLRGFGTFMVVKRKSRTVRHPGTGEITKIPEKEVPMFLPHARFKEAVSESLGDLTTALERDYQEASYFAKTGENERAVELFRSILSKDPHHIEARNSLGLVYESIGEYRKAIEEYRKILDFQPDNVDAYYNLGAVYWEMGLVSRAEEAFKKALELAPSSAEAHYNMGVALYKKGLYQRAIGELEKAVKLNPDSPRPYYYLGASYTQLKMYDKAVQMFKDLLEKEPENRNAYWYLGLLYDRKGRSDEAVAMYRKADQLSEKKQ
ncbi:MAG TPA: tetratricopeptide repeat protein [Candidatus Latescibacteria bacterium]|nr:tetratricopeptide repeat protein [Candidatus Latescibacterota bacterium]